VKRKYNHTACRMTSDGNCGERMRSLSFAIVAASPKPAKVSVSIPAYPFGAFPAPSDASMGEAAGGNARPPNQRSKDIALPG
jgi:hypothetical protein